MGMRIIKSAMMLTIVALAAQFVVEPPSSGQSTDPITDGAKVTIAFTITVPETRVVVPNNVSQYVPGQRQLIPALEQALERNEGGGHQKRVDLEAEEAFGHYDERNESRQAGRNCHGERRWGPFSELRMRYAVHYCVTV